VRKDAHQAISFQVATILRRERQRRGLSLSAVAQRAALSYQMISYVERGMRSPTLDTLLRITTAMQISLASVLGEAEKLTVQK